MKEFLEKNEWLSKLKDIIDESASHETAEEAGYNLFRIKKTYEELQDEKHKAKAKELFMKVKPEVEKLISIDMKDAQEKKNTVRIKELIELLEKVKSMSV